MTWADCADFVEQEIRAVDFPSGQARVLCQLWTTASSITIQARLYNYTNSVSVGASATIYATSPTDATFPVTLSAGTNRYRLQVTSDTAASNLWAVGMGVVP